MIAAYVRVSSRSQNNATQREAISRAASARGDEIVHWFEEKKSAKKLDRPVLAKLRDLVQRGEVTRLYVFRLDRLARSGIRDTLTVLDELRAAGCTVLTINDGFNLEGPAADVVVAVLAWAAQMERVAMGERIMAARARVEASGGRWGRPARVSAVLAERIRAAKRQVTMFAKNGEPSIRELAVKFKVPRSTVAEVLSEKGAYAATPKRTKKRAPKKRKPPTSG